MPARTTSPPRRSAAASVLVAAMLAAGCGSAAPDELPPPAGPRASPPPSVAPAGRVEAGATIPRALLPPEPAVLGDRVAVVRPREREVELQEAATGRPLSRASAGVGPARAAAHDRWLWVTDTAGEALLVFRTRPELELVRRVYLPGGPYAIAYDRERFRLWVTLTATNEVVELPAHGRPRELRRFPTVRQPDAVAVDAAGGPVLIGGADALQRLVPPPSE